MPRLYRSRSVVAESMTRTRAIDGAKPADDGTVRLLTSSSDPIRIWGGYREILNHSPEAIDTRSLRSLLVNHQPGQLAGSIKGFSADGKQGHATVTISPDARMQSGVRVADAVADGSLAGVSIGFDYDLDQDADIDEDARTVTVKRWRLLEISLTPSPADPAGTVQRADVAAHIRSLSRSHPEEPAMLTALQIAALAAAYARHAALIIERAAKGDTEAQIVTAINEINAREASEKAAREIESAAKGAELRSNIRAFAVSHGLTPDTYLDCKDLTEAGARMVADKAKAEAAKQTNVRMSGTELGVTVTADAGEKMLAACTDALVSRANPPVPGGKRYSEDKVNFKDLGLRHRPLTDLVKKLARHSGHADAAEWDAQDAADLFMDQSRFLGRDTKAIGRMSKRASANQTAGMFQTLLANVLDKSLLLGYEGFGEEATSDIWASTRVVRTFENFTAAALSLGTLQKVVEDNTLQELTLADGGYSGHIDMYGGTISLDMRAILSDTLDQFFRIVGMAGYNAAKTADRLCYAALMNAVWTYDTTAGSPLATAGSVDSVRLGFRNKKNRAGQKLGNSPRFLLHPAPLAIAAQNAVGMYTAPGQQNAIASVAVRSWKAIESLWLDDLTVSANANDTSYFLVGDKTMSTVDKLVLEGFETPTVMEFDAGSSVARKFKIWQPMASYVATAADDLGHARVLGAQQGTP